MSRERTRRAGVCTGQRVSPEKHTFAKHLRRNMTRAEKVFWEAVRHNRFMDYQFRRQQVIHGFIADFYRPLPKPSPRGEGTWVGSR